MADDEKQVRTITLDAIQRDIDLFLDRADPAAMAAYEARVLASQRNRPRTTSKKAMLDELQQLRRAKAGISDGEEGL